MKKLIYLISVLFSFFSCKPRTVAEKITAGEEQKVKKAEGVEYVLQTEESVLRWRGTKPGGEHVGTVRISEGTITIEKGSINGGKFTIDLNTIVNEDLKDGPMNEKLVGHLKSGDFFYVEKYPLAYFEIVSVEARKASPAPGEGEFVPGYDVTGNLTMHGITKSITFPAKIDLKEENVLAVTNPFAIDRTQWNVSYMSKSVLAEFKDNFIDDNMILSLDLKFEKKETGR